MGEQLTLWSLQEPSPSVPALTKAAQWITDGLTDCLPPGVPLSIARIITARFINKNTAVATVEMMDGKAGKVEVFKRATVQMVDGKHEVSKHPLGDAWRIHWLELEGGDIHWTGSAWERIALVLFGEEVT